MKNITIGLLLSFYSMAGLAAINLTDNLNISGFGSTSWSKSDNEYPLFINREIDDEPCWDCDTTFGLQLDYFNQNIKASVQVAKRPQDHWNDLQLEWAFVGYTFDDIELRAGRLRLPSFLASEYFHVGYIYPTARPVNEVYDGLLGITAFNGFSALWSIEISDDIDLIATPYYGLHDSVDLRFNKNVDLEFKTHRLYGLNLTLNGPNYRINAAYMNSKYDQKSIIQIPTMSGQTMTIIENNKNEIMELFTLGFLYEFNKLTTIIEGQYSDYTRSWFAQLNYSLDQFTPYTVYGQQFDDENNMTGDSYLIGLRYDILSNVALNFEWQYITAKDGYQGAFTETPDSRYANLYTAMVSFIF